MPCRIDVRAAVGLATCFAVVLTASSAQGADGEPSEAPPPDATPSPAPDPRAASSPPSSPGDRAVLEIDPIADGSLIVGAAAFAAILDLVNGTGEIRPQQISPSFDRSQLLGIDRGAVSQTVDSHARLYSNLGIIAAGAFAAIDPVLSGFREKNVHSGIVDAVIYAEAISVTWGVTNLVKMAVRRPRPQAYIDAETHKGDPTYSNSDTDSSLSFFSGHAAITATISSTATYLAFLRSPQSARPWITLGVGTALTTFVSVERVRGGAHFPTDVMAGAIAGAGIGVLVTHLHRTEDPAKRRVWVAVSPERANGGTLDLGGIF